MVEQPADGNGTDDPVPAVVVVNDGDKRAVHGSHHRGHLKTQRPNRRTSTLVRSTVRDLLLKPVPFLIAEALAIAVSWIYLWLRYYAFG